jgi:hypothetical protein
MADDKPSYVVDQVGRARVASTEENKRVAGELGLEQLSAEQAARMYQDEQDVEYAQNRYGNAGTTAMGAVSGLSAGLVPAAGAALAGLVDPKAGDLAKRDLRALEQSPYFLGGELAGALLPAIFSGGASLEAGAGARGLLAGTPMGLIGEAGGAAERLAGRFLPEATGIMGKAGRGAVEMAARGAAEGGLLNLSHTISSNIIHDKPMAAEALAWSGAEGALFGGVLGAGAGALGGGLSGAFGRVAEGAGSAGEKGITRQQALALKGFGATTAEDLERMGVTRGGEAVQKNLNDYHKILTEKGESLEARSSRIAELSKETVTESKLVQRSVLQTLDREAPAITPSVKRIVGRMQDEVVAPAMGTYNQELVSGIADRTMTRLMNRAPDGKVWQTWVESRYQLAEDLGKAGVASDIKAKVLNVLDDEIRQTMEEAAALSSKKGLAEAFQAASTKRAIAEHMAEMADKKLLGEVADMNGVIRPLDMAQFGGAAMYNPMWATGMLGAKWLTRNAEAYVAPKMAEMAYQMSVGAKAAASTVRVQDRIQGAVRGFFGSTKTAATKANQMAYTIPRTREAYEKRLEQVQGLMSPQHQTKLREYADSLARAGQADLANQMLSMNGRAVQYLQLNAPTGRTAKTAASLGPMPKYEGLDMKDYKFLRIGNAVTNPLSVLDRIQDGTVSRDELAAMKYVYPELHADIVSNTQQEIVAMKARGEFLPADKISTLGLVLDAPVAPMLEKGFIDAVQASLAPAQAEPPAQPPVDASVTPDDFRTPLEKTLS